MPDLSQAGARTWLRRIDPNETKASWPPAVRPVEDQGDTAGLWVELGHCLEETAAAGPDALTKALRTPAVAASLRVVLAQTGAARLFRFVHWVGEKAEGNSYAVLATLTEGDTSEAKALRATIAGFGRRATLSRIFAPERVAALQTATELAMTETLQ